MIYIRHAEKSYRNGDSSEFSLDPDITVKGKENARHFFTKLLNKYGVPNRIICSPYLRTRETAKIAQDVIFDKLNINVEITCDSTIGEFLGNHFDKDIRDHLQKETLLYNPVPPETWQQFCNRICQHYNLTNLREIGINSAQKNIWYITHGLIIKSIASLYKHKIAYPRELRGIRISEGNLTII